MDAALDTQITAYAYTSPTTGKTITYAYADVGGFSVPTALGNDITTVTGFEQRAQLSESDCAALPTADAPCPVPRATTRADQPDQRTTHHDAPSGSASRYTKATSNNYLATRRWAS